MALTPENLKTLPIEAMKSEKLKNLAHQEALCLPVFQAGCTQSTVFIGFNLCREFDYADERTATPLDLASPKKSTWETGQVLEARN